MTGKLINFVFRIRRNCTCSKSIVVINKNVRKISRSLDLSEESDKRKKLNKEEEKKT